MSDTLVAAKQEYTQQLCDLLNPLIYNGFKSIWKKCKDNNKMSLKTFQEKLTSVPIWNQDIIDNEYSRIIKETDCKWLDKLIEAVFLSNVKVLSTIRIGKIKTINIKVPETKKFIHHCYIEAARRLWQDPYLIDDREDYLTFSEIKRNEKRMHLTLSEAIEKTISKSIPIQNILESYLNDIETDSEDEDRIEPQPDLSDISEEENEDLNQNENENKNENENLNENLNENTQEQNLNNSDIFMTEPQTENVENRLPESYPRLEVSDGNNVEDAVENFNFENGKSVKISSFSNEENKTNVDENFNRVTPEIKQENEEDPFFSDTDSET